MQEILVIGEIVVLYFLSQVLTKNIFRLLYRLTKRREIGAAILTILLFPGTVIHELGHIIMAGICGVPTGRLQLLPDNLRLEYLEIGKVAIAKTNPLKRTLIGIAPLLFGLIMLVALAYLLKDQLNPINTYTYILIYLIYTVSNSLFPSKIDLKGFWPIAIFSLLVGTGLWYLGVRIEPNQEVLGALDYSLRWVIAINATLLLPVLLVNIISSKGSSAG